ADATWALSPRGLAVALVLGLVATALAYLLYTRALRLIAVNNAVTLALAEPVVASLLGVLLLGERLPPLGWFGVALVATGLLTLTVARR
ncbi:MAG: EamA family transporter, partial [Caldilineaceae bacterium]